jgi:hypothetical protein
MKCASCAEDDNCLRHAEVIYRLSRWERQRRGNRFKRRCRAGQTFICLQKGLEANVVRYEKCNVSNSVLENENGIEKAWSDRMRPHVDWKNS